MRRAIDNIVELWVRRTKCPRKSR